MNQLSSTQILNTSIKLIDQNNVAYMSVLQVNNKSIIHIEMDPGTATALWEIAKGILVSLGAKALAKWFGFGESKDVEDLLRKLLLDIADVIHISLDEAEVKQATSEMQGLNVLMREYNNSPKTSLFRLERCITDSALVLKRLENLLPLSSTAYIYGVLVRLAAAQELSIITKNPGEKKNVKEFALDSLPKLKSALQSLLSANEARVSNVSVETKLVAVPLGIQDVGIEKDIRDPVIYKVVVNGNYTVDGVLRSFSREGATNQKDDFVLYITSQATAARELDLQRVREDFMSRVGIPLTQSIQNIEQISNMP